jgi:hypothetical protein
MPVQVRPDHRAAPDKGGKAALDTVQELEGPAHASSVGLASDRLSIAFLAYRRAGNLVLIQPALALVN